MKIFNVLIRLLSFYLLVSVLYSGCKEEDPSPNFELPEISTLPVKEITSQSAISGGDITDDGGASVIVRGLVWDTSENPTTVKNDGMTTDGNGVGMFTSNLTHLLPYSTYYIRAYATNSEGTKYGNQVNFETLPEGAYGTVTDIDGNVYWTIATDDMEWMAENLRVTKFSDGTPISTGLTAAEWAATDQPAYVEYPFEDSLRLKYIDPVLEVDIYGLFYNAYTVLNGNNPCPEGWYPPTEDDWDDMKSFVKLFYGLTEDEVGNALKSCRQVNSPLGGDCETDDHPRWNENAHHYGTNLAFFLALPAGYIDLNMNYGNLGEEIYWWMATNSTYSQNPVRWLSNDFGELSGGSRGNNHGFCLRCIRPLKKND